VYTQCPDCATVFRVGADVLRAAQGNVRCGVCSTTFNALENLSEKPFKAAPAKAAPAPDDSMTVEELPGGEDIELSSEVEALSIEPPPAPARPVAAASTPSAEDRAMEYHGNSEDLAKVFVELPSAQVPRFGAGAKSVDEDERTDEHPILVLDERDEPEEIVLEGPGEPAAPQAPRTRPAEPGALDAPRIMIPDEMRRSLAAEALRRAGVEDEFEDLGAASAPRRWPWNLAAALLLMLLAVQIVHSQRDQLIRRPGVGPLLAQAYALLGLPFAMPTDLTAYELRQLGAASDASGADRLLLRASIVNRAVFSQPYPLLRLALQDRFGTTLFVRDIAPADYLPRQGAPRLLAPGGRADAEIRIVDPGKDAVGFEMDVCLPVDDGVRCASQLAAAAP